MAKTYAQLQKEIEALKAKAEVARRSEMAGVVSRIRQAVLAYGLTAEELGFGTAAKSPAPAVKKGRRGRPTIAAGAAKKVRRGVKYRDGAGNSWSGRGPKPGWFKAALEAGTPIESLSVDRAGAQAGGAAVRRTKQKLAPKYRDDAGNTWSGRGPKPAWFKTALDAGKTLEELTA